MKYSKKTAAKKMRLTFFVFWWMLYQPSQAQEPSLERRTPSLTAIEEKIFVHTDKSFYVAGEIIWFKLYVRDHLLRPARVSQVAYVEIIQSNGLPALQAQIELEEGMGSGSFYVPLSIQSGHCYLRAYTMWMKNRGPEAFFEKQLTIVNTQKSGVSENESNAPYDIQFFPQGGRLVQGLDNVIAFKITDRSGKGASGSGVVLSPQGDTLQRFGSFRYGMGRFVFRPASTAAYKVLVQLPDTLLHLHLPAAEPEGHVLHLRQETDSVILSVSSNASSGKPRYLVGYTGPRNIFSLEGRQSGAQTIFGISRNLPAGITRLTILNESLQPVCERLYFKKPDSLLTLGLHSAKEEYSVRERISLEITATGPQHDTTDADLSMGVYLVDELQALDQENMGHYFWLTSELAGRVEEPGFYFSDDPAAAEATENLLLTQGWRRIEAASTAPASPGYVMEWEGPVVKARMIFKSSGLPASNKAAYLSFAGKRFQLASAVSDDSGILTFVTRKYYGRGDLVLQAADSGNYIVPDDSYSHLRSRTTVPSLMLSPDVAASLTRRSISSQLQNQFLADRMVQFAASARDTTPFYGRPDKQYLLDDYTRFTTMEEVLREFVAEVRLRKSAQDYQLQVRNNPDMQFFEQQPLVLLDGVPVLNTNTLIAYNPLNLKQIDVVARRYIFGAHTWAGIVSFRTYQGNLAEFTLPQAATVLAQEGVQWQRVYYAPVYDTPEQKESRIPDFRNQLQWIPDLETTVSGTTNVSFFSSDVTGKFAVVVHGITASGLPGTAVRFITVRKP